MFAPRAVLNQAALRNTDPVVRRLSRFLKAQVLFLDRAPEWWYEEGRGQQLLRVEGTLTVVSRTEATRVKKVSPTKRFTLIASKSVEKL